MDADPFRGHAQGFGDPGAYLEGSEDEQPIAHLMPPLAGAGHGRFFCGVEVG